MCQPRPPDRGRSVTRNTNRTPSHDPLLLQMLVPLSIQVQLKSAHLVGRCRIGERLTVANACELCDMTTLHCRLELAGSHVLEHALTQRTDSG